MKKSIFNSICLIALVVLVVSCTLCIGISYQSSEKTLKTELKKELDLIGNGVESRGMAYLKDLRKQNLDDIRITWVDNSGNVLYDNKMDKTNMDNHLNRDEIKSAFAKGYGESSRKSNSLVEKYYYSAKLLKNQTAIRVSATHHTVWVMMANVFQVIIFIIFAIIILGLTMASKLSKKIDEQNDELVKDKEKLQKTESFRKEFTSNISHELKTPLHAISGYAELIEEGVVKESDIKLFAKKIKTESIRMSALVEDIIKLTHLESELSYYEKANVNLYDVASNVVDSLELAAKEKNIEIRLEGEKVVININPEIIYTIIYNLCDNAIKYNVNDGTVNIKLETDNMFSRIIISDTGIGISPEAQERIFERFYRVDKSRSKKAGGTGLGLSIVKYALKQCEGVVTVKSERDKGSIFTVIIPKEIG